MGSSTEVREQGRALCSTRAGRFTRATGSTMCGKGMVSRSSQMAALMRGTTKQIK